MPAGIHHLGFILLDYLPYSQDLAPCCPSLPETEETSARALLPIKSLSQDSGEDVVVNKTHISIVVYV